MIFILALFAALCLFGAKLNGKASSDPLRKNQTDAIRGIFAFVIFLSHFSSYVVIGGQFGDNIFAKFLVTIGQMMVAPFLFYSGYGIYVSAK